MDKKELYELKERLTNAQYNLEGIQNEVDNLTIEEKEIFNKIVIW